jgi:hypothetical protein
MSSQLCLWLGKGISSVADPSGRPNRRSRRVRPPSGTAPEQTPEPDEAPKPSPEPNAGSEPSSARGASAAKTPGAQAREGTETKRSRARNASAAKTPEAKGPEHAEPKRSRTKKTTGAAASKQNRARSQSTATPAETSVQPRLLNGNNGSGTGIQWDPPTRPEITIDPIQAQTAGVPFDFTGSFSPASPGHLDSDDLPPYPIESIDVVVSSGPPIAVRAVTWSGDGMSLASVTMAAPQATSLAASITVKNITQPESASSKACPVFAVGHPPVRLQATSPASSGTIGYDLGVQAFSAAASGRGGMGAVRVSADSGATWTDLTYIAGNARWTALSLPAPTPVPAGGTTIDLKVADYDPYQTPGTDSPTEIDFSVNAIDNLAPLIDWVSPVDKTILKTLPGKPETSTALVVVVNDVFSSELSSGVASVV